MSLVLLTFVLLGQGQPDAPTPLVECEKALQLVPLGKDDVVYDLGCGDGRLCAMAAVEYGCRAVGIDYDAEKVRRAKETARINRVEKLVAIYQRDLRQVSLDKLPATVFYVYLPQELIHELTPKLQRTNAVVISYIHPLPIPATRTKGNFFIYEFRKPASTRQ